MNRPPHRTVTRPAAPPVDTTASELLEPSAPPAAVAATDVFDLRATLLALGRAVAKALAGPEVVNPLTTCVRGVCRSRPRLAKVAVRVIRAAQSQAEEL